MFSILNVLFITTTQASSYYSLYLDYDSVAKAARFEQLENVKKLIREGADLEEKDDHRAIALHNACDNQDLAMVLVLIEAGAIVDSRDGMFRKTPLHIACKNGNLEIIKVLIKRGADVNAKTQYEDTPLSIACKNGNLAVCKVLVENGAII